MVVFLYPAFSLRATYFTLRFNVSVSVFTYCHKKTDQERRLSQFC